MGSLRDKMAASLAAASATLQAGQTLVEGATTLVQAGIEFTAIFQSGDVRCLDGSEEDLAAPFWCIYRSNSPGSGMNGAGGLVAEDSFPTLDKAMGAWEGRRGHHHGYAVADNDGRMYVVNAEFTANFDNEHCKKAIEKT